MSAATLTRPGRHRRRAGMYVAVLTTALLVSVIGLSALTVVRVQNRGAEGTNDLGAARLYAQAAIEIGMHKIQNESNWRTGRGEGFWVVEQPFGEGKFSLEVNDLGANGLLESSSNSDPVLLTGTGLKGEARYKLSLTLVPATAALTCLEVSLHAGNDLFFDHTTVNGDQIISANDSVTAADSNIFADVEAVNAIGGGTYWGSRTVGITPRTVPDPATVFDFYVTNGTAIDILSLPASADQTVRYLRRIVLSPASNPHGATDLDGIYVIDCQGVSLVIEECRIVGTLVIRNGGSATGIFKPVNWEPAITNYPALMVEGNFLFETLDAQLSEASASVNFNPAGTPYLGVADGDMDDVYPSVINGLVYVSGDAEDNSAYTRIAVNGVLVVGNTLTAVSSSSKNPIYFDLTYDAKYLENPPPGFAAVPKMVISPGTWKQVVD